MTRENTVNVPRLPMKVAIANAIWELDRGQTTNARVEMCKAQDILSAAPLHEGEGEPVAWRFWHEGGWNYSATDPSPHLADCVEREPLYATPPPSVEVVAKLEAELVEARTLDKGFYEWMIERDLLARGEDVEWSDIVVALTEHEIECAAPSVEVERLREALRFYLLSDDDGSVARAALSRKREPGVPTPGGEGK